MVENGLQLTGHANLPFVAAILMSVFLIENIRETVSYRYKLRYEVLSELKALHMKKNKCKSVKYHRKTYV